MIPSLPLLLLVLAQPAPAAPPLECSHVDLQELSNAELKLRRNLVFARHGRPFEAKDLKAHFGRQPWYRRDPRYTDQRLTSDDKACVKRIGIWERSRGVMWRSTTDLDGDGRAEAIFALAFDDRLIKAPPQQKAEAVEPCPSSECAAVLIVGDEVLSLPFSWPKGAYRSLADPFRIVDVDKRDPKKEVWFRQHARHDVDPELLNTFIRFDGQRLFASQLNGRGYDAGTIELLGKGRLELLVSGCPEEHAFFELRGEQLVQTRVEKKPPPAHGCAACPFVYVHTGDGWSRQGEILRRVVGSAAETWQRLSVRHPGAHQRSITIRLAEEKPEVTYLNAVRLQVDGRVLSPRACAEGRPAFCAADGERHVLREGEHLDLHFDLPDDAAHLELEAFGFYEPIVAD